MDPTTYIQPALADYMSMDRVRSLAPSVFTSHKAPGTSDRYQFVNTAQVIETLRETGYEPVKASQSRTRNADNVPYTKHVVRLMHRDYLDPSRRKVGDVVPQVILTNAHNRTSAWHMMGGLFRLWCSNGMAYELAGFQSVRVLHNDPAIHDHIIDGAELVKETTERTALPMVEKMTKFELTMQQLREFAAAATYLKWGEVKDEHIEPLLACRRSQDEGRDLWSVLNRVQENAVKGGYKVNNSAGHLVTSRGIQSVDRDLDFNVNLWRLGAAVLEQA